METWAECKYSGLLLALLSVWQACVRDRAVTTNMFTVVTDLHVSDCHNIRYTIQSSG